MENENSRFTFDASPQSLVLVKIVSNITLVLSNIRHFNLYFIYHIQNKNF